MPDKKDYIETINGVSFKMIFVEGGKVTIEYNEQKTEITVPDFYLGETPVTQELWRAVMGKDPEELWFKGNNKNPVVQVSWLDIVEGNKDTKESAFLKKLNNLRVLKHQNYNLPSEAIWQFAAQDGNQTNGYKYSGSNYLKEVGWYNKNSSRETKPVKLKMPNKLGFYDMSGNVREWCSDKWTLEKIFNYSSLNKISGENQNNLYIVRGGSWDGNIFTCRITDRFRADSNTRISYIGFRLSRY